MSWPKLFQRGSDEVIPPRPLPLVFSECPRCGDTVVRHGLPAASGELTYCQPCRRAARIAEYDERTP